MPDLRSTTGVILAGGLSRRMGGIEKSLLQLSGKPLIEHIRDRLAPQVGAMVISANGDPARFSRLGLPVISDTIPGNAGPLAGILAAMAWSRENHPETTHVLSVAADTPFFPLDLRERLANDAAPGRIAVAASGGRTHPVFALWPVGLERDLAAWLVAGNRKVMGFVLCHSWRAVDFPDRETRTGQIDPFYNINTPENLARAAQLVEALPIL